MTVSRRTEFLTGVRDGLPILLGVAPFGMIYGVLAIGARLSSAESQAMSSIVFAGSAQFIAAQLFRQGTPAAVMLLTVLVVNVRHALYSASIAPHLRALNWRWKAVLAYLLTDEAYAVAITHYGLPAEADAAMSQRHWYYLGAGLALWVVWQISTAIGIALGAQVPVRWGLDLTLALTFIALVVPALKDRASLVAALAAGAVAVLAAGWPYKLGLMAAAMVGIGAGVLVETVRGSTGAGQRGT
jgi:4-azaleucine resistance transporter AzlC